MLANQVQRRAVARAPRLPPKRDVLKGATVLLVEDDELIRATTAEMLSEIGCEAKEAANAEAALKVLDDGPMDALLTDVGLPGISGLQLARDARSRRPELRLVLATGDSGLQSEAAQLGAVLLVKPYQQDTLRQALDDALNGRRSGGPP